MARDARDGERCESGDAEDRGRLRGMRDIAQRMAGICGDGSDGRGQGCRVAGNVQKAKLSR